MLQLESQVERGSDSALFSFRFPDGGKVFDKAKIKLLAMSPSVHHYMVEATLTLDTHSNLWYTIFPGSFLNMQVDGIATKTLQVLRGEIEKSGFWKVPPILKFINKRGSMNGNVVASLPKGTVLFSSSYLHLRIMGFKRKYIHTVDMLELEDYELTEKVQPNWWFVENRSDEPIPKASHLLRSEEVASTIFGKDKEYYYSDWEFDEKTFEQFGRKFGSCRACDGHIAEENEQRKWRQSQNDALTELLVEPDEIELDDDESDSNDEIETKEQKKSSMEKLVRENFRKESFLTRRKFLTEKQQKEIATSLTCGILTEGKKKYLKYRSQMEFSRSDTPLYYAKEYTKIFDGISEDANFPGGWDWKVNPERGLTLSRRAADELGFDLSVINHSEAVRYLGMPVSIALKGEKLSVAPLNAKSQPLVFPPVYLADIREYPLTLTCDTGAVNTFITNRGFFQGFGILPKPTSPSVVAGTFLEFENRMGDKSFIVRFMSSRGEKVVFDQRMTINASLMYL